MGLFINKDQKSSGRVPAGFDYISGQMFYGTAPSVTGKWATYQSSLFPAVQIKAQQMFSVDDAIAAGILPNTDNTASTATFEITAIGTTGDTCLVECVIPVLGGGTTSVTLADYTIGAADTTIDLQGAALVAAINALSYLTGFSATYAAGSDTLTITAPKKLGKYLNTGTPYSFTIVGTFAGTLVQNVIAGTASQYAIWYYQISEYFRKNATGNLWVGIISASSSFNELLALMSASGNTIRQIGIYDNHTTRGLAANITATCQQIQTAAMLLDQSFSFEVFYSPNITAVTDLSTMPNGQLVAYNKVSVVISQDGGAQGAFLYVVSGQTIGNIGCKIGTTSASRVSADDAQAIPQFNLSDGIENNIPAFGNGKLLSEISANLQTQLQAYRYIFFAVFTGNVVGTYWTDNYCFCVQTNRYAFSNDNRVASKLTRILNTTYIPLVKSEVLFNEDGTISDASVEMLQDAGVDAITAAMITGFGSMPLISGQPIVTIDPTQDLQNTGNLQIVVKIGENGIARDITISQGFTN